MRSKKNNEIRTKKDIKIGEIIKDKDTGAPVALIKGNGNKYDTFSLQEMAEALYGEGTEVFVKTIWWIIADQHRTEYGANSVADRLNKFFEQSDGERSPVNERAD